MMRAPRDLFCDRRKLSGVPTEPRGAMREGGQGLIASITEAARLKIGAHRSPRAGSPPDRSLRRWVSRAPLAPNVRSRSMCSEAQHGDWVLGIGDWVFEAARLHRHPNPQHLIPNPASAGPFEFLCSPRNCGFPSREHPPHHTQTTSLELNAVVDLSLPTRDEAIISAF